MKLKARLSNTFNFLVEIVRLIQLFNSNFDRLKFLIAYELKTRKSEKCKISSIRSLKDEL